MACVSGPEIVNDGLVLHLDAANTRSYPGSGTVWKDLSGEGHDGTLVNGPVYTTSKMIFDGVNDNILLPDITDIRLSDVTFEFWFKLDDINTDHDLLNKGVHNVNTSTLIWFDSVVGSGDLGVGNINCISALSFDGTTQHWISTNSNTIQANTYYHLCVVLKPSNNMKYIYLNGILAQSNSKSWNGIKNTNDTFRICSGGNIENPLNGEMNKFSIYNRALTAQEVKQNFEATRSRYGI